MAKKTKQKTWQVICMGMVCLTVAELYNLSLGNNGTYFAIFVGIICTAMGIAIPKDKILK